MTKKLDILYGWSLELNNHKNGIFCEKGIERNIYKEKTDLSFYTKGVLIYCVCKIILNCQNLTHIFSKIFHKFAIFTQK